MHDESVAWTEGMFLRPHHMQAEQRHVAEIGSLQVSLDHGFLRLRGCVGSALPPKRSPRANLN